ncbi:hypothetical protein [Dictyobacter aurantiacus]|uniref:DUF4383 domain-containing protein n=1 Tax=Dictyobacter aurantiacus TaxID=1936993 RepID=A0A401Z982_9CHLR|nr:hypothetical protein [Dictyobacter aurantiacus]GCE03378.1 hypothetical protein KDAU_07070 [Dictyobacter aurantiacus]
MVWTPNRIVDPWDHLCCDWFGLMHVNAGDNVFHLIIGIVAIAVGFFVHEDIVATNRTTAV